LEVGFQPCFHSLSGFSMAAMRWQVRLKLGGLIRGVLWCMQVRRKMVAGKDGLMKMECDASGLG
jgi:hypothetical protein